MLSCVTGAAKNGGTQLIEPADDDGGVGVVGTPDAAEVAFVKDVHEAEVTPIPPCTPNTPANHREVGGGTALSRQSSNHDNQFFFEDEVFRIDRQGRVQFGVVTETTESYSSDDDDDSDDALGSGEVRVAFYPDGKEIVQSEQSIGLADRTLMPGDVVRRRRPGQKDLGGQAGYVRDVNVRADVKVLGSKYVLKNVPAERLRPISEWSRDAPVCFGTWIGTTVNVSEAAVLRCSNGARLEITSNDFYKFKDAYTQCALEVFNPNVYYPGNIVVGRLPPVDRIKNLTPDIPLPTNRKGRAMFTVESTRTTSIDVAWTCRAFSSMEHGADVDALKQPKSCIKGDDLNHVKRLNIYESYMLQIHDRFYLKYSICDKLIKYVDWEEEQAATYLGIFQRQLLEQNQSNTPNNSGSLANLETLPGSSSRTVRNQPKFRRLSNKQGSGVRLARKQQDENESHKVTTTAATKARAFSNDDTWDSVDEDEYDDDITDLQEATEIPETWTVAAEDNTKQFEVTAVAASTNAISSAQSPKISTRCAKRRNAKKKMRSVKKLLTAPFVKKAKDPKDGDELIVETLVVFSSVTVVWQDGTVETGIHSTQLYPIHHLDNHEFFPGDFVSNANVNGTGQTDYGVIQSVHHDERTAKVKWFNIYSNMDNPVPFCKDTEELSVYDLKDHSDYQYRPGTMVIRVSNFTGEDADSTAGQVIENFPDGRVRVWWVKGHITMCYPQDLFEINHNDQDHEAYDSDGSEDSWETQSENSHVECSLNISGANSHGVNGEYILAGLVQVNEALGMQKEIFRLLPNERKPEVLIDLLKLYNNCRFLDCMLKTSFFDEEYFQGILKFKNDTKCTPNVSNEEAKKEDDESTHKDTSAPENNIAQFTSTPTKRKSTTNLNAVLCKKCSQVVSPKSNLNEVVTKEDSENHTEQDTTNHSINAKDVHQYRLEYKIMLNLARGSILQAFVVNRQINKNDSGVHSRGENSSTNLTSQASDSKETSENTESEKDGPTWEDLFKSVLDNPVEFLADRNADVCEVFLFLIKDQISKCRKWIVKTSYKGSDKEKEDDDDDDDEEVNEMEDAIEETDMAKEHPVTVIGEAKLDVEVGGEVAMDEQPLNLNALCETLSQLDSPMASSSPSHKIPTSSASSEESLFEVLPIAPASHHFINMKITPTSKAQYQRAVQREYRILQASLPPGMVVRAYEDRMDLLSVMMVGPKGTPYQNALFFFDFQMGKDYPKNPPTCLYVSYCTERLNPNLYEEGKVCVSLLGTWSGRDTEMWTSGSTILQVLVSIQGLILVDEPYYNEAGYEKQRGTQLGKENSRVYNEMAIIKIAHSTVKQLQRPPHIFQKELIEHFSKYGNEIHGRMQAWADYSSEAQRLKVLSTKDMPNEYQEKCELPEFPLLPCSRGFCIAIKGVLDQLQDELATICNKDKPLTTELNTTEAVAGTAPRAAPEEV
ncbi:uncharacterized protein Dwil_GK14098 [Drosophila willistoni]|uniref:UBC core domain-containing protein n=1 Tax=Drosophila willistoni TaxID=7260 RepID=B4NLG0_DROWI|nr:(E3-independent) E2 ubiquitin-conjugating enzyme UBE2O [Drosophila willistoni]EDW84363.1 uncharacterized protein Dwil_GK14098 [Drosophila willistoni]